LRFQRFAYRLPLGFKAKAALALSNGADPDLTDKPIFIHKRRVAEH